MLERLSMIHVDEGTLQAYLDDELGHADRSALESHVTTCISCRTELEDLRRIGAELTDGLAGTDVAAGLVTALQRFRMRREALDAAPAAATVMPAHERFTLRPLAPPAGRAPATLLKAAAVVLLIAGAASAAIPGSPLNDWILGSLQNGEDDAGTDQDPVVVSPVPTTPEVIPAEGAFIEPVDGAVHIALQRPPAQSRIRVRWTDGETSAAVHAAGTRVRTRPGYLQVWGFTGGDIVIDLPRSLERATVEVDGRGILRKDGGTVTHSGAVSETSADELIFQPRS